MSSRQGDFSAQIDDFIKQATEAIDATMGEVVVELSASIIKISPVDTGRFRGNWQIEINSMPSPAEGAPDINGERTLAEMEAVARQFTAGDVAYIVNHLPYAIPLEYGHSDQAPAPHGIIRLTLSRFQQIVEEAARKNRV